MDAVERFKAALDRFRERDYSAAIQVWRELQRERFDHPNLELYLAVARREQARVLQFAEDYGTGLASSVDGLEVEPVEGPVERARRAMAEKHYTEAARSLEEALTVPDADVLPLRVALAQVNLILGHLQEALFHLEQARLVDARDARVHATMGAVFREMGRPLEAEREYRQALDLDETDASCWYGLARLYHQDERYDMCESCLRKVLALRPGSIRATSLLDEVRRKQEHTRTLIDEALEILASHPNYPDWHHRIAVYYSFTGEYEKAREHLVKAEEINPRLTKSIYQRALLEARLGNFEASCQAFEKCLAQLEQDEDPSVVAARELMLQKRFEEAAFEYSVVVVPEENTASRQIDLGKRLFAESFLPQARRELERALEQKPHYPDGNFVLGRVASEQGKPEEAARSFKKALELSPRYQQAALALARTELELGNVAAARELLDQFGVDPKPDLRAGWQAVARELERSGG